MKLSTTAIAAALIAGTASAAWAQPAAAPAQATQPQTLAPSKGAAKAIIDLDTAVKANDRANIPAKIAAAQAVATSNNDKYLVAGLRLKAAVAANDPAQMLAAADGIAASGVEQPAKVANIYDAVGTELYKAKQFPQAVTAFSKAAALNPSDLGALFDLGQAQLGAGQPPAAVATFRKAITLSSAGGQKPDEELYTNAVVAAYNAHLPEALDLSRSWVAAYPSPTHWHDAIAIFRNETHADDQSTLDLMRLMQASGALKADDYRLFIQLSANQLNYNEAQKLYDAGVAANVIDPAKPEFSEVRNFLKAKQIAIATPADLEAAIKSAPNPTNLLRIGDRFYAMGNYNRAAQVYRDVAGKPGADKDLANLHLGMALARSGDKAGATAALTSVGGTQAAVAKYWLQYAQQQA